MWESGQRLGDKDIMWQVRGVICVKMRLTLAQKYSSPLNDVCPSAQSRADASVGKKDELEGAEAGFVVSAITQRRGAGVDRDRCSRSRPDGSELRSAVVCCHKGRRGGCHGEGDGAKVEAAIFVVVPAHCTFSVLRKRDLRLSAFL